MNQRELEQLIIDEVMKALAESSGGASPLPAPQSETLDPKACAGPVCSCSAPGEPEPAAPAPKREGPAILTIFTGAREPWDINLCAFKDWRQSGIHIDAVLSPDAVGAFSKKELNGLGIRVIDSMSEIQALRQDMSAYGAMYLPSICRNHAAKLALAITDDPSLKLTIAALAHKVPTIASTEGLAKDACIIFGNNVPGVQEVLDNYRRQLETMGVKLAPARDAVRMAKEKTLNKVDSQSSELITCLITEEDAARLKGPVVKAARGGLITPLAMEALRKRGIDVEIVPPTS